MSEGCELIEKISKLKIAVIGDFIEDRYIIGAVNRISPEAPVPVLTETSRKSTWGGAGNVFNNLIGLGATAHLFCDLNPYYNGFHSSLQETKYHVWIHPSSHCVKTRIISGNHHIVRIDKDTVPVNRFYDNVEWKKTFEDMIDIFDCVVFSDYHKGAISESIAISVIDICKSKNIPVVVDAKKDFHKYIKATILKCNGHEWAASPHRNTSEFIKTANIESLVITHGDKGIELTDDRNWSHCKAHNVPIVDVCGAGDTVTALLAIGEALKMYRYKSVKLANICAAEVCKHSGVYPITKEDLVNIL